MREIRFKQPIFSSGKFSHWHYWGFVGSVFIAPMCGRAYNITYEQAQRDSQQYIGLKDKNDKEMCEGDILRFDWGGCCEFCKKTPTHKAKVKFGAMGATVESYRILDPQSGMKNFEVIGNATEHPELLETKGG